MPQSTARMRRRVRRLFERLLSAPLVRFPASGFKIEAPKRQGVYIIVHSRRGVLHVGRTTRGRNGLYQRLKNHLQARSSFVVLFARPQRLDLRKDCRFRYLAVANPRTRAFLEALATGELCPAHIGTGFKARRTSI